MEIIQVHSRYKRTSKDHSSSFLIQRIEHQKQYHAVGQIAQDVFALKTRQMEVQALPAVFTSLTFFPVWEAGRSRRTTT